MDDLMSAGHMGILRAQQTWDPAKSKFSAYALPWVRHFIRRTITKARIIHIPQYVAKEALKNGENLPYTIYLSEDDDSQEDFVLESPELDMEELIDYNSNKKELITALASLNQAQRDVITLHFYKEVPFTQISTRLNLSLTRVKQIYTEAMNKLRLHLTESDDDGN